MQVMNILNSFNTFENILQHGNIDLFWSPVHQYIKYISKHG
uniref:Uncharacterized protein n=1 Tax=Rhizophora mucronata TaxID=61149 RepID=A0A2P2PAJ8_RHIMU